MSSLMLLSSLQRTRIHPPPSSFNVSVAVSPHHHHHCRRHRHHLSSSPSFASNATHVVVFRRWSCNSPSRLLCLHNKNKNKSRSWAAWASSHVRSSAVTRQQVLRRCQNATRRSATSPSSSKGPPPPPPTTTKAATSVSWWHSWREYLRTVLLTPRTIPIPRYISPHHHTITLSEVCGHSSFLLVACSYAVPDDFLLLRSIAVAGSSMMVLFTYFHPHGRVLWLPFQWNVLFIVINAYRIGYRIYDRHIQCHALSEELLELRTSHFYAMDPTDFYQLVQLGTMETLRPGDVLIEQGERNPSIRLVVQGELLVIRDEHHVTYELSKGNFISECGLHAGLLIPNAMESCCRIVAKPPSTSSAPPKTKTTTQQEQEQKEEDGSRRSKHDATNDDEKEEEVVVVRLLSWDRTELMELLHRQPSLRRSLKAILSWDIISKLKSQRQLLLDHDHVADPNVWTHKRNEQSRDRYKAIVQSLLSNSPPPAASSSYSYQSQLEHYRRIHHISNDEHAKALEACDGLELGMMNLHAAGER